MAVDTTQRTPLYQQWSGGDLDPTPEKARSQSIRAVEAVSLGCHPRSVANGSRDRLQWVGAGLPRRCPRFAKHKLLVRGVAATGEILVSHQPDCEVEP